VVVDRHAMSVACGRRLSDDEMDGAPIDHPHYYNHVVRQYQDAAHVLSAERGHHVEANHAQAESWLVQVRKNQEADKAGDKWGGGGRAKGQENIQKKWDETAREHHPSVQHLFHGRLWRLAYGETRVPPEVDTLREEECPVCGEKDVYTGQRCPVCGFVSPPQLFKDPDLDKARQQDLRQDKGDDAAGQVIGEGAPGALPQDGLTQPGQEMSGQEPDALAQQGSFPDADDQLQHPDQLAPDGVPGAIGGGADGAEGAVPGESLPVLTCMVCGFTAPAAGAVTTTTAPDQAPGGGEGFTEGEPCPQCGQGVLMSSDDVQEMSGQEPGEQNNMGQAAVPPGQMLGAPGGGTLQVPADEGGGLGPPPGGPGEEFPEEQEEGEPGEGDDGQPLERNDEAEDGQDAPPPDDDEDEEAGTTRKARTGAVPRAGRLHRTASRQPPQMKGQASREDGQMTISLEATVAAHDRLIRQLAAQNQQLRAQNSVLRGQLQVVGSLAGIEPEFGAIEQKMAARLTGARRHTADMDNPASPVPDPPEQPAPESTEQALAPETEDDPRRPGMTPGSVTNVPAMQTTTPLKPGVEDQTPPAANLIDVTAPVTGTNPAQDGGVPLQQRRIETDVRVGDPMSPEIAFPWNMGPDSGQDSMTGSQSGTLGAPDGAKAASLRTMASVRLARLRLATGQARGDELELAGQIETSAGLSNRDIEREFEVLGGIARSLETARRSAAPLQRTAAARPVPSMAGQPRPLAAVTAGYGGDSGEDLAGDADLFM
jgi:hypothetical protein